jgi:gluconokinase
MQKRSRVVLLMGVSGSGKTTVGRLLATELGCRFIDADDYHATVSKQKMQRGEPLDDLDRGPWLEELRQVVRETLDGGECAVLACSALKERYRTRLRIDPARVPAIYLKASAQLISERLRQRVGHFATESLLASQLAALEEPTDAIVVDAAESPAHIVERLRALVD